MSIYIKTHTVRKGETLENLVLKYGIPDVEMLRYFHNQNSPKNGDYIGSVIFAGQEIFIPQKTDIEKLLEERKKRREDNKIAETERLRNQVFYPNFLGLDARYSVNIIHDFETKPDEKKQLEFLCRHQIYW